MWHARCVRNQARRHTCDHLEAGAEAARSAEDAALAALAAAQRDAADRAACEAAENESKAAVLRARAERAEKNEALWRRRLRELERRRRLELEGSARDVAELRRQLANRGIRADVPITPAAAEKRTGERGSPASVVATPAESVQDDIAKLSSHLRKLDTTLAGVRATAARSTKGPAKGMAYDSTRSKSESRAVARMDSITRQLTMIPM